MKLFLDDLEDNDKVMDNFKSIEFKEKFVEQVKKDTWGNGIPMIYMDKDGWLVEEWSDGRIEKLKKIK